MEYLQYVYVLVAMPKTRRENFISSASSEEKKRMRTLYCMYFCHQLTITSFFSPASWRKRTPFEHEVGEDADTRESFKISIELPGLELRDRDNDIDESEDPINSSENNSARTANHASCS
jgi:hypothetical protein